MKNKKGFISISIIYSFFIVFLLIMLAMLADYVNKRYLLDKFEPPIDDVCVNETLSDCIKKLEEQFGRVYNNDIDNSKCVSDAGMYTSEDDYGETYFYSGAVDNNYVAFAGYMWRIVRINGDGSVRLIYTGKLDDNKKLEDDSKPFIIIHLADDVEDLELSRFNESLFTDGDCTVDLEGKWEDIKSKTSCTFAGWEKPYAKVVCYKSFLDTCREKLDTNEHFLSNLWNWAVYSCTENDWQEVNDNLLNEAINNYNEKCVTSQSKTTGAYLPNMVGYMSNKISNLAKYDSEYDNQDSSAIKKNIDLWYNKNLKDKSSFLSLTTIFCGDKNMIKYHKGNSVYEFAANKRISENNASLICEDTGTDASYYGNYNFYIGKQKIENNSHAVINLSRYNVDSKNRVYYFNSKATSKSVVIDSSHSISSDTNVEIVGYYTLKEGKKDGSDSLNQNSFKYVYDDNNTLFYRGSQRYYTVKIQNNGYVLNELIGDKEDFEKEKLKLRNNLNNIPIGNGDLTNPIALLSADEAVKAGLIFETNYESTKFDYIKGNNTTCSNSYLLDDMPNNSKFWTMTLALTDSVAGDKDKKSELGATYFVVEKLENNGQLNTIKDSKYHSDEGYYMRPVINVKGDINDYHINYNYSGRENRPGTKNNPIVIGDL